METSDYEYLTASRVISNRKCVLDGIVFDTDGQDGWITVYDGDSDKEPVVGVFYAFGARSREIFPPKPILLSRGLYVDFSPHVAHVTIFWRPFHSSVETTS